MTAPRRPIPTLLNELQDRLILPGMLRFTKLGYAWRKRSWTPLEVSMHGRTVVVTGATSGLGEAAARQIAALGARVVIVGRSREKAEASRKAIVAASGNDNVGVALADLSLVREVRKLAHHLLESEPHIHVLVNNAGVLLNERTTTAEGNEVSLATNLLAPFLLTQLLVPRLKACAPARIINVSSGGMYTSGLALDDLQYENGRYKGSVAYARAKRALVTLTQMWAEDLAPHGVVVNAMHPGWADTPGVATSLRAFHSLTKPLLRDADEGADTITWLAAAPEAGEVTGGFWLDREPHRTHVLPGTNPTPGDRRRLWAALEALTAQRGRASRREGH
jgi:NAD(P)-dependent dehydrogenase (short-subunit alcohol dehydrogenase family)